MRSAFWQSLNSECSTTANHAFTETNINLYSVKQVRIVFVVMSQIVRTCLVAGLLKTLSSNRNMPLPLKLFEVQEVVVKDASSDTGAINQRHLAAVVCNTNSSNFEVGTKLIKDSTYYFHT